MRIATILFAAATVLATGCGVDPLTNPTTYREFLKAQAQIDCETSFRCCGTKCSMGTDDTFLRSNMTSQKLIDMGTYKYDATQGLACLDALRARKNNCDALFSNLPSITTACARILVGTAAVGQTCDTTLPMQNCVAGAYCVTTGMNGPTCAAYKNSGESCVMGTCNTNLYCDATVPAMAVCKPLGKTGEPCMTTATCDTTGTKLVCLPSKTCGSPQDDGAACASSNQCKSTTCTIPAGMMMGTCQPSRLPPKLLRDDVCGTP